VTLDSESLDLGTPTILEWIERCARAVAAYYGSFPVPTVAVELHVFPGHGLRGGQVRPIRATTIAMALGRDTSRAELEHNWSMTHEMVHLAFPNVSAAQHWIEEGLASYVEPIARAQLGWLDEASVWREWIENLHLGLPEENDRGLDHTPTWGRTYWGGALYCFIADLRIREQSSGRYSLRDALVAITAQGGNITRRWPLERALDIGDAATHTSVLGDLYREWKDKPVDVDLPAIWKSLGVRLDGAEIRYDATAPLAGLRERWMGKP